MRLIDADELFKKLENTLWNDNADRDIAEDLLLDATTIDPESLRPRGHWESPSKLLNIVNCTACKTTFPGDFDEFRYCPNCGAKMEEKTDET